MEQQKTLILVAIVAIVAISILVIGTKKQTAQYLDEVETKDISGQAYTAITPPPDPDPHTSDCPTPKNEYCPLVEGVGTDKNGGPSAKVAIAKALEECNAKYDKCKQIQNAELADNTKTCEIQNKPCKLSKKNLDEKCSIFHCRVEHPYTVCKYNLFNDLGVPIGPGQCNPTPISLERGWSCLATGRYDWEYPDPGCSK